MYAKDDLATKLKSWHADKKHKNFVWFAGNLKMRGLDGNPRAGATFVPCLCVFPAEPRLFVSIYLNVGDEQKLVSFSWHVGLETPTGELVCAAVNPEVM